MKKTISDHQTGILLVSLLIISALVYLPRLSQIGYLNDDWYLMYSAHTYGPKVFADIFSIDRPARALVLGPAYTLFGDHVLYYNLSAYFFRLISAISFFWLLQMLWPRRRTETFLAALLFLIYPGFLSQVNGIDYQSQIVSLAAAMTSIALSVKAALTPNPLVKGLGFVVATLLGWFYLGLVEYFLGLEFLRFVSLLLSGRSQPAWKDAFFAGLRNALPALIIPAVFLIWRLFFFESERGATDIGAQLTQFKELPVATSLWWLVRLISNTFDVIFLAWGVPLYQFISFFSRLRDLLMAAAVAVISILLLVWLVKPFGPEPDSKPELEDWRREALVVGLITAFAGLVPVILVNRQADFGDFSRYTLASSAGSALVLVSVLFSISWRAIRWAMFGLLVTVAVFTHHANTIRAANETQSMQAFWWQAAWRIPQVRTNSTLVANYPVTTIQEDYFVWGPANLIYYPEGMTGGQIRVPVSAVVLNRDAQLKILVEAPAENDNRRSIRSTIDYRNILILSMPSPGSCVQVIQGSAPELSPFEEDRVMVVAPFSDTDLIDLDAADHVPPGVVFGPEPPHGWCYYYEKADLARQRGEWAEVVRLGDEAMQAKLVPQDDIEWMPFLQAYARAGDAERLDRVRRLMKNSDPFVVRQACQRLGELSVLSSDVVKVIQALCSE